MNELTIISGKGGTGKTSIAASFALLADRPVIADCDVDAADLHLILAPRVLSRQQFYAGHEAFIRQDACSGCGLCEELCRFGAISSEETGAGKAFSIMPLRCEGCGVCVRFCPEKAIDFPERLSGEWMVSQTRCGPMVHARLGIAAENSGKLVSTVRRQARRIAMEENRPLLLVDGPPGIGCPVTASVTGASMVLVVTEPTVSGEHDLERVLALARHFEIRAMVCVNKWDLNGEMAARIEEKSRLSGALIAGRIRYDSAVTKAQIQGHGVIELECGAANDIRLAWQRVSEELSRQA